ncbi:hypothetical protein CAC42_6856 [Sphaceloma murrayae]|uniref:Uncharacterized protein n=1 Tax=Sphaceloma murrayae TaxID=2082308 RepID=A0A2K1QHK3_9PEZI|nr:hypothetical protein CAC42_6856 [Sphaceloma murrayae]
MTTYLFPITDNHDAPQKRLLYPSILSHIVRGAEDAIDALETFRDLVQGQDVERGYLVYDAHAGDTACQLRAGILNELATIFKNNYQERYNFVKTLEEHVTRLRQTRDASRELCFKMTHLKIRCADLGVDEKSTSAQDLLANVMWSQPDKNWVDKAGHKCRLVHRQDSAVSFLATSADSTRAETDTRNRELFGATKVIPFLVFAYTLARYKTYSGRDGMLIARLDPTGMLERANTLIADFWDTKNREYRSSSMTRPNQEVKHLQNWLCDYSCSWLQDLASRIVPGTIYENLFERARHRSEKGMAAISGYIGFLLLRKHWASMNMPIVLVNRFFCSSGHHLQVYEGNITLDCSASVTNGPSLDCPARWRLEASTIDRMKDAADSSSPVLVIMGNSYNHGSQNELDKMDGRSIDHLQSYSEHKDLGECTEAAQQNDRFIHTDHDRLALSIFANHDQYPFELPNKINKTGYVESLLSEYAHEQERSGKATAMLSVWKKSLSMLSEQGLGSGGIRLFGWQHVFLERKDCLARKLRVWQESERVTPLYEEF